MLASSTGRQTEAEDSFRTSWHRPLDDRQRQRIPPEPLDTVHWATDRGRGFLQNLLAPSTGWQTEAEDPSRTSWHRPLDDRQRHRIPPEPIGTSHWMTDRGRGFLQNLLAPSTGWQTEAADSSRTCWHRPLGDKQTQRIPPEPLGTVQCVTDRGNGFLQTLLAPSIGRQTEAADSSRTSWHRPLGDRHRQRIPPEPFAPSTVWQTEATDSSIASWSRPMGDTQRQRIPPNPLGTVR